jgi:hypothetical protein
MTPFKQALKASILIASFIQWTPGYTQNHVQTVATACPGAREVGALHLYGEWLATWPDGDAPATLQLGRNPEHADGVRGTLQRGAAQALVAGDVDDGDFNLEESTDGRSIAATWTGKVLEHTCGKEIQGVWTRANGGGERRFILRKRPGWN